MRGLFFESAIGLQFAAVARARRRRVDARPSHAEPAREQAERSHAALDSEGSRSVDRARACGTVDPGALCRHAPNPLTILVRLCRISVCVAVHSRRNMSSPPDSLGARRAAWRGGVHVL